MLLNTWAMQSLSLITSPARWFPLFALLTIAKACLIPIHALWWVKASLITGSLMAFRITGGGIQWVWWSTAMLLIARGNHRKRLN